MENDGRMLMLTIVLELINVSCHEKTCLRVFVTG